LDSQQELLKTSQQENAKVTPSARTWPPLKATPELIENREFQTAGHRFNSLLREVSLFPNFLYSKYLGLNKVDLPE